jgi:hypothetical protein
MTRKRVAVGAIAVAAVAAAVVVAVAHSGPSAKHQAIAGYIRDVDTVQQQMQPQLIKTSRAFRAFSDGSAADVGELSRARITLRMLHAQLRGLAAPAEAARLRTLLLRLAGAEEGIAAEVESLAQFAPRYAGVIRRSQAASTTLSRALAAVEAPTPHRIRGTKEQVAAAQTAFQRAAAEAAAQQADAVETYVTALTGAKRALERLRPPPVMHPSYKTQLRMFSASISSGAALAAELRKRDRSQLPVVSRRFTIASRLAGGVSAQQSERAAVEMYNARVRAIGALQEKIRQELVRLQTLAGT